MFRLVIFLTSNNCCLFHCYLHHKIKSFIRCSSYEYTNSEFRCETVNSCICNMGIFSIKILKLLYAYGIFFSLERGTIKTNKYSNSNNNRTSKSHRLKQFVLKYAFIIFYILNRLFYTFRTLNFQCKPHIFTLSYN